MDHPIGDIVAAISPEVLGLFRQWIMTFPASETVYRLGGPPFSQDELTTVRAIRDWFAEADRSGRAELAAEVPQR